MMYDKQFIKDYLEGYSFTTSNNMDDVFHLFKSDVSSLERDYRQGEVYIYTKQEYINSKKEMLLNDLSYIQSQVESNSFNMVDFRSIEEYLDELEEIESNPDTIYIERCGVEGYESV